MGRNRQIGGSKCFFVLTPYRRLYICAIVGTDNNQIKLTIHDQISLIEKVHCNYDCLLESHAMMSEI